MGRARRTRLHLKIKWADELFKSTYQTQPDHCIFSCAIFLCEKEQTTISYSLFSDCVEGGKN